MAVNGKSERTPFGALYLRGLAQNKRVLLSISGKQNPMEHTDVVEAAGIEPASEKDPRATSTGLDWLCVLPRVDPPIRTRGASFLRDLAFAPASADKRQPDKFAPHRSIGRQPDRRGHRSDQGPRYLRSVGKSVIVVRNYSVAAFYEASGASTCHYGFCNPVETSAPPFFAV